jgi:parallel beta-helix repeat protein
MRKYSKLYEFVLPTVFCLLLLGGSVGFASFAYQGCINPLFRTTLYVGGSVPGNYSTIQEAIDNASDGDIVFVFNGIYYENVVLNKSIGLFGENQKTTIIDGEETGGHVVTILSGRVTVTGFTIQNSGGIQNAACVYVVSNNNQLVGNTITCVPHHGEEGIWMLHVSGNTVQQNTVSNHHYGIWLENSVDNDVSKNVISNHWSWGIILGDSHRNLISENCLTESHGGIYLRDSTENMLVQNEITNNMIGADLTDWEATSAYNDIRSNTFLDNTKRDATFSAAKKSHNFNKWYGNYWNRPRSMPKVILGSKQFLFFSGFPFHFPPLTLSLPWINVDWHPAQEPCNLSQ